MEMEDDLPETSRNRLDGMDTLPSLCLSQSVIAIAAAMINMISIKPLIIDFSEWVKCARMERSSGFSAIRSHRQSQYLFAVPDSLAVLDSFCFGQTSLAQHLLRCPPLVHCCLAP